ncbi:MAG: ribosome recycling factor [Nitrospinaceae bacterium]|jgi:ribosome recycling factor|nr:ribosome recycling factor [Nitrospinaceae bacterium]MBT3432583.1 ribosome recycling factor [Nitrospinaceae bacterium]MBT3822095.1 ribosome recycling factor [Nitrospinaceae bacterium]MBT4095602.1 ribosome recycling factor [Nitrospinaceae bacterium]MBT4429663.1 ribosome recycling factor [Nitrospinaceae bacterium]
MAIEEHISESKEKMTTTLEAFKVESARVRTGRASTSLVSNVRVDYYGTITPLNQLATINVPEPQLIVIQPYDAGALGNIEKAIQTAELGLNPANDGKLIRVPVPPLTEERRKEMVKMVKKIGEDHKVSIRNIRREINDILKSEEKDKEISEDDLRKGQGEVQKVTDDFITQIDKLISVKEEEILKV